MTSTVATATVLVVDDEPMVREVVARCRLTASCAPTDLCGTSAHRR